LEDHIENKHEKLLKRKIWGTSVYAVSTTSLRRVENGKTKNKVGKNQTVHEPLGTTRRLDKVRRRRLLLW